MQLPSDMLPIKKWHAFIAKLPHGSKNEHRIIIVYKQYAVVNYFYVTSQIEKACNVARNDIKSIVKLNTADWDALTKDSCVQCNKSHLHEISEDKFKQIYDNGELKYLGEIPEKVKNAIIYAICMSKTFTDTEKAIYTTENDV